MGNVLVREDQPDALDGPRRRQIGEPETGMGMGAAQHEAMQGIGGNEIGGVATRAGDEALVLEAANRLADSEFHGSHGQDDPDLKK